MRTPTEATHDPQPEPEPGPGPGQPAAPLNPPEPEPNPLLLSVRLLLLFAQKIDFDFYKFSHKLPAVAAPPGSTTITTTQWHSRSM